MTRLERHLQPGETVLWRNKPGPGLGVWLLISLALAALFVAIVVWLGGGWDSISRSPERLSPLVVLAIVGGQPMRDAIIVTDRRLLLTRGLLRRTVIAVARADIRSVELEAAIPYYGQQVSIACRDAAAIRLYRPGEAGAAAYEHERIETVLRSEARELRDTLAPGPSPWGGTATR